MPSPCSWVCCYHKSQGLLGRTEAPWSFGNYVHRLMPTLRLRSDIFGSGNDDSLKVKTETFMVKGDKKERRKYCSKRVCPAF